MKYIIAEKRRTRAPFTGDRPVSSQTKVTPWGEGAPYNGRFYNQEYREGGYDGCEDCMVTCLPGTKVVDITSCLDRLVESAEEEEAVVVHVQAVMEAKLRLLGRKLKTRTIKVVFSEVLSVPHTRCSMLLSTRSKT